MTNLEIKEKIDSNNRTIERILNPSQFILNNTVKELLKENDELQKLCKHSFVEGYCEYCYKNQEDN